MEINTIEQLVETIEQFKLSNEQVDTWKIEKNDIVINKKKWREIKSRILVD
jgi:hypothetical protein